MDFLQDLQRCDKGPAQDLARIALIWPELLSGSTRVGLRKRDARQRIAIRLN